MASTIRAAILAQFVGLQATAAPKKKSEEIEEIEIGDRPEWHLLKEFPHINQRVIATVGNHDRSTEESRIILDSSRDNSPLAKPASRRPIPPPPGVRPSAASTTDGRRTCRLAHHTLIKIDFRPTLHHIPFWLGVGIKAASNGCAAPRRPCRQISASCSAAQAMISFVKQYGFSNEMAEEARAVFMQVDKIAPGQQRFAQLMEILADL